MQHKKLERKDWIRAATRFRYALPVLAELKRDDGCKFVTLVRRLRASDRAIRRALDYLLDIKWIERNPGYGHPSRPEYILANSHVEIARSAMRIWDELAKWDQSEVALERWPLPVLDALISGDSRFSDLQRSCPGISARALAMSLKRLVDSGLSNRKVVDGNPPATLYEPTNWATTLLPSA